MVNKQSHNQSQTQQQEGSGHNINDEVLNEDLILHCWRGVQSQVRRVIEFNKSQGVTNPDAYVGYHYADGTPEPMSVKQKIRWLNITRRKKNGTWITVDSLVASGRISDIEREVFGTEKIPRIELYAMSRIKTHDNSEYLVRHMQATGLSEIGAVVTLPLNDADFTKKVPISPDTAKLPDGTDVKILKVGTGEFYYESSPKIYTTPFNKENVLAALEKYPPSEDNGYGRKISYTFNREGSANGIGISSLEEFLTDDFNSTFERIRAPAPQININSKDLATFVKLDRESRKSHEQYQ